MTPREALVERLSLLLGFEDGAADVLEHLLTIESSDDLSDYLSQLLGRVNEDVKTFVQDVGRFQRGELLSVPVAHDEEDVKLPAAPAERTYEGTGKGNEVKGAKLTKQTNSIKAPIAKAASSPQKTAAAKPQPSVKKTDAASNKPKAKPDTTRQEKPPPKSHPPKGTPSVVCGCFGNVHKPLTNCLYCGRISCEREGYDYCPFCGLLVEKVATKDGTKAWEHKERLLRFDRDFARRTVVLDDQADYFTSSTWLTEEEKAQAEEKEAAQQERFKHGKQKLDITF